VLEIAVADTGPVLHLAEIGCLRLFELFERLLISQQVRAELRALSVLSRAITILGERLRIEEVLPYEISEAQRNAADFKLQKADLSVIALAHKVSPNIVLTDDLRLRKALESQRFTVVGSVGVLVRAFRMGLINRAELEDAVDRLLDDSSLYTSSVFRSLVRGIIDDHGIP